jgi:transcriptional regulator with XRE-family HTH domain
VSVIQGTYSKPRRAELAAFLRHRRERVSPADVGLAPGVRRRTPGLRREEVAQLAGVGVTWYTWLEQGRPINASVQVLDAIARVLGLGPAERWHLYRLAEVPGVPRPQGTETLPVDIAAVLDALDPVPAAAYNGKFDLLASNESYAALFPQLVCATGIERNALWQIYARPDREAPVTDVDVCASMIGRLKANYVNHIEDPQWTSFVAEICSASPEFARLWSEHPVGDSGLAPVRKSFRCFGLGVVQVRASGFPISGTAECRMVVYLPDTAADAALIAEQRSRLTEERTRLTEERRLRPA